MISDANKKHQRMVQKFLEYNRTGLNKTYTDRM